MSSKVNSKKFFLAALAVLVVHEVLGFITHQVLMTDFYQETYSMWRMPEDINMGLVLLGGLIFSLLFTYVFTVGYEGKGLMEGGRYGMAIGNLIFFPAVFTSYAVMPISFSMSMHWYIYGIVQTVACGFAAALVYQRA